MWPWGHPDAGQRTFRIDRVVDAETTDLAAEQPDGFALARAWEQVVDEVERRRSQLTATLLVEDRFVPVLRTHFGRHCHADPPGPDGRARGRVAAPTALGLARTQAGWGGTVEVLEPEPVRGELARIGAELCARYADGKRPQSALP